MKKLILLTLVLSALTAAAGTPQPAMIVCGRVRDAFGFPYANSGRIVISRIGTECSRYDFGGSLPDGLNYRMTLNMDSGGTPYTTNAVQSGDVLTIAVEVGGAVQPLIPTNRLVVGSPGSAIRLDLCTGTDADGDGLPDEWEQMLCAQSGGRLDGIADVRPGDDFDGDGLSNLQEFNAGTFAFLATDLLKVGAMERVSASRMKFRFLTGQGMNYRVVATESLTAASWYPMRFTDNETDPVNYGNLIGDGGYKTIYLDVTSDFLFIRVAAQ